jgi:hypothetical protein
VHGRLPVPGVLSQRRAREAAAPDRPVLLHIDTASGAPVIVTDDYRFFGSFTDRANAADPLRVFTVAGGRLVNVTRAYPLHIERDAARAWRGFVHPRNGPHDGLGALAVWAADECSLRREAFAWRTLDELLREGRLQGRVESPGGERFLRHLRAFLIRTGYASQARRRTAVSR